MKCFQRVLALLIFKLNCAVLNFPIMISCLQSVPVNPMIFVHLTLCCNLLYGTVQHKNSRIRSAFLPGGIAVYSMIQYERKTVINIVAFLILHKGFTVRYINCISFLRFWYSSVHVNT